jgi:hypothetical protein
MEYCRSNVDYVRGGSKCTIDRTFKLAFNLH